MINCEFKKTYNFFLGMIFFCVALMIAGLIIAIALNTYEILISDLVLFIVGIYSLFKYLTLKKQFLKIEDGMFNAYVITYKSAQKPTKINAKLSFIISASNKRNVLILKNERGQNLEVYNLVNAKKVAEDINNLLNNSK